MYSFLKNSTTNHEAVRLELKTGDMHNGISYKFGHALKWDKTELLSLQIVQHWPLTSTFDIPQKAVVTCGGKEIYDIEISSIANATTTNIHQSTLIKSYAGSANAGACYRFPTIKDMTGVDEPLALFGRDFEVEITRDATLQKSPGTFSVFATFAALERGARWAPHTVRTHRFGLEQDMLQIRATLLDMHTTGLQALYMHLQDPATHANIGKPYTALTGEFTVKLGNEDILKFEKPTDLLFNPFNAKRPFVLAPDLGYYLGPSFYEDVINDCKSDTGAALTLEFSKKAPPLDIVLMTLTNDLNVF